MVPVDDIALVKRVDGAVDQLVELLIGRNVGHVDDGRILDFAQEVPFLWDPRE